MKANSQNSITQNLRLILFALAALIAASCSNYESELTDRKAETRAGNNVSLSYTSLNGGSNSVTCEKATLTYYDQTKIKLEINYASGASNTVYILNASASISSKKMTSILYSEDTFLNKTSTSVTIGTGFLNAVIMPSNQTVTGHNIIIEDDGL